VATARVERAPAKVNLTLRVLGRRADGYHQIESLVAFAGVGDTLAFTAGHSLALALRGPTAAAAGELDGNLVLKAARALAERIPGLKLGQFALAKWLPVAAGLGGGSADAAAALRLLARANRIAADDPRLMAAARACGADVPVCLDPRPRLMRGIGEILSAPLDLPRLPAVLVNPGVAVPTREVFAALKLPSPSPLSAHSPLSPSKTGLNALFPGEGRDGGSGGGSRWVPHRSTPTSDPAPQGGGEKKRSGAEQAMRAQVLVTLAADANDLEAPALALAPVIADVLAALRVLPGCRLARMSGSGATCFGLFDSARAAAAAARVLRSAHPDWWVRATVLAG
jgi:4-diphosphocytidyl-2-C-methyl-D-erythritol kinase